MQKKKVMLVLLLIVLLGSFLRLYKIGSESLWIDEGATALAVKDFGALGILNNTYNCGQIYPVKGVCGSSLTTLNYSNHNDELPLYFVFLSLWSKLSGISESSLRFFSAIFGIFSIILVFYLVRLLYGSKIALLVSFLTSINLTLIYYSQEARQYSYLLFLSLLSLIFLLKYTKAGKSKYLLGLLFTNLLIIYSQLTWAVFILFEGIFFIVISFKNYIKKKPTKNPIWAFLREDKNKLLFLSFLLMGILYLAMVGKIVHTTTNTIDMYGRPDIDQFTRFTMQLSTWIYPSEPMRQTIRSFSFDFNLYEWVLFLSVAITAAVTLLLFAYGVKKFYRLENSMVMLLMFFIPLIFAAVFSMIHPAVNIFNLKQVIYIIPAYLTFVSLGALNSKFGKFIILLVIMVNIIPIHAYFVNVHKQEFREASDFLPKNEPIFLNIASSVMSFRYYYGENGNTIPIKNLDELKSHLGNKNSFWVLLTFTKYSDPKNEIRNFLDKNYQLSEKKNFFDIELLHYRRKQ